jgi:hypothetical protein
VSTLHHNPEQHQQHPKLQQNFVQMQNHQETNKTANIKELLTTEFEVSSSEYRIFFFFGSLFYDTFSVTRLYSIDDRVASE